MTKKSALEPFKTFASAAIPIDIANCDTDQIIPARFLRRPELPQVPVPRSSVRNGQHRKELRLQ